VAPTADDLTEQTPRQTRLAGSVREFIRTQNSSAVVLVVAVVAALVWANAPWSATYEEFWQTTLALRLGDNELSLDLRHWVNDGLMAFFFFVAGLELRREFDMGELRSRRRVATPVAAALGGVVVPALIFLAFNAGESTARGWGIAMGTDTAFALAVLSLVGGRWTPTVRTFLLTLVIVDDVVALTIVALAYTEDLSPAALSIAVALYGVVLLMRRAGVRHGVAYFVVSFALWVAMIASGVHATVAGIALGALATAHPPARGDLERAGALWRLFREEPTPAYARSASRGVALAISPNERMQQLFTPWTSYVIVPLFALANGGVEVSGDVIRRAFSSPVTLGILFGLVVGKLVGVSAATWLFTRRRLGRMPLTLTWPALIGAGAVAGIGFTVALLIADITFDGEDLENAKVGILAASVLASVLAWVVFRVIDRLPAKLATAGIDRLAAPLVDLLDPVDELTDHVRGPADAPVTLVEYGDFECPYCGKAEPVVRELVRSYGNELRFVFRHLPLSDVHEHAELAAEASEAAAAQGKFWEMHDLLFTHQDALTVDDLLGDARRIGLDLDQFSDDLDSRRYALRVTRDVEGADASGVAGTPTFFINGRRHYGPYDLDALTAALRRAALQAETSGRAAAQIG
jgi:Na+/H+ antiporter NhaA